MIDREPCALAGRRTNMATALRYWAAACQTDLANPPSRAGIARNTSHMLAMIDRAVQGYAPFGSVRLVVFPEFAHAAPIYPTVEELLDRLAVPIPNEHTERYQHKARELGVFIQTGSFLETDNRYPGAVFNTTCLIGPDGILTRYRKVHPWIPWEVHASPHDIAGYAEDMFPVADTEIGRLGVATCYDWLFPEAIRQLALKGAEVEFNARATELREIAVELPRAGDYLPVLPAGKAFAANELDARSCLASVFSRMNSSLRED